MPKLWVDTNQAFSVVNLRALGALGKAKGVEILIHPQVYLERRRQMRVWCEEGRENGRRPFNEGIFDGLLTQEGLTVPVFTLDQKTAAGWADELYRRYPTSAAWEDAKKRTLGGELQAGFRVLPGDMPMTTDWLISLLVEGDVSARVITRDGGEEWAMLVAMSPKRALSFDEALAWLGELPDAPPASRV